MLINNDELFEIVNSYYEYWAKKDVESLKKLFSENIILIDPIVKQVNGINNVLSVNKDIFDSTETIIISDKKIYIDKYSKTVIGEIELHIDGKVIEVVDIFNFNGNKISKITAYLDTK